MIFKLLCKNNGFKIGTEVSDSKVREIVQLSKFSEEISISGDIQRETGEASRRIELQITEI